MYEPTRVLIWGKTYPELSSKYTETVCTGGLREDGSPIRLYPVPLRYLEGPQQYSLYQWINVPTRKSTSDPRPESYKIDPEKIKCGEVIKTYKGSWEARSEFVFRDPSWHFDSMDALQAAQRETKRSIGMMRVGEVDAVTLVQKPKAERAAYHEKMNAIAELVATDMFRPEYKQLEYLPNEIKLSWRCADRCKTCHRLRGYWALVPQASRTSVAVQSSDTLTSRKHPSTAKCFTRLCPRWRHRSARMPRWQSSGWRSKQVRQTRFRNLMSSAKSISRPSRISPLASM